MRAWKSTSRCSGARQKSIALGIATTALPLLLGSAVGLLFGYAAIPAIVIGSLLASHTLLGLPVVNRLGLGGSEPVTAAVGATVMSDTLSLVVFAVCVSVAATLAATLVAHQTLNAAGQRLLDDRMLDVVLVLVFTTAMLGPVLTERFASRMAAARRDRKTS